MKKQLFLCFNFIVCVFRIWTRMQIRTPTPEATYPDHQYTHTNTGPTPKPTPMPTVEPGTGK